MRVRLRDKWKRTFWIALFGEVPSWKPKRLRFLCEFFLPQMFSSSWNWSNFFAYNKLMRDKLLSPENQPEEHKRVHCAKHNMQQETYRNTKSARTNSLSGSGGKKKYVKRSSHHHFPPSCLTRKFWEIIEPEEWPAPLGINYTIKLSPVYIPRLAQEIVSVRSWELTCLWQKECFQTAFRQKAQPALDGKRYLCKVLTRWKKKGTNATAHYLYLCSA